MELSHVIIGPITTEKSERAKAEAKVYTLKVAPKATKVDVKNALKRFYDIDVSSVRVMRVGGKTRRFGRGNVMRKRDPFKKVMVTLGPKSKSLDLTSFK